MTYETVRKRVAKLENQVNKLRGQLEIQERINEQVTRLLSVLEQRTRGLVKLGEPTSPHPPKGR